MKRVAWLLIVLAGCIDPYTPPEIKSSSAILVIDGHIDINSQSVIKLTRSQNLYEDLEPEKVYGAQVILENENGVTYPLTAAGDGSYSLAPQSFAAVKHRLLVRTADAKEYSSEFVEIKNSPPIDSVSWDINSDLGVNIYANTHSTESGTGYYRWKFEETWQYTSAYQSIYVYNYSTRQAELRQDDIFNCWQSNTSTDILVGSTSRLNENIISEFPITKVAQRDERLRFTYSILLKQYAISEAAYSYWQQLKKTTEDLGTIFSPLPSQVTGNYRSITNPEEPVLGYFSMGVIAEKRIFINSLQLPRPNTYNTPYDGCNAYELFNADVSQFTGPYLLTGGIPNPNGPGIIGYYYSIVRCADCRSAGGVNAKPNFWP
ncbi:MAG: hypothetical protein RI909_1302 [Bacteroidota bacterium]|jgi:hypothetical protein